MDVDDILEVTGPLPDKNGSPEKPKGWLRGKNMTKNLSGIIQTNFVVYVETKTVQNHEGKY